MSRHLIIRCDAPGCASVTETSASDTAPTSIDVPDGWLTLRRAGRPDRHYCSEACLHATRAPEPAVIVEPVVEAPPAAAASKKKRGGAHEHAE